MSRADFPDGRAEPGPRRHAELKLRGGFNRGRPCPPCPGTRRRRTPGGVRESPRPRHEDRRVGRRRALLIDEAVTHPTPGQYPAPAGCSELADEQPQAIEGGSLLPKVVAREAGPPHDTAAPPARFRRRKGLRRKANAGHRRTTGNVFTGNDPRRQRCCLRSRSPWPPSAPWKFPVATWSIAGAACCGNAVVGLVPGYLVDHPG